MYRFLYFPSERSLESEQGLRFILSLAGVFRPVRFAPELVMSLSTLLEVPILTPRSRDDLGVKNLVNDRGVIVGAFRGLVERC